MHVYIILTFFIVVYIPTIIFTLKPQSTFLKIVGDLENSMHAAAEHVG